MKTTFELVIRKKSILHKINILSLFWSKNGYVLGYICDTLFVVTGNTKKEIDEKMYQYIAKQLIEYQYDEKTMEYSVYEKDLLSRGASVGIEI